MALGTSHQRAVTTKTAGPWSLDDLPVAVLILHGSDVVAVNAQWTTLTGLDFAASCGDGWLTAGRRQERAVMRAFPFQSTRGEDAVGSWRLTGPGGRGVRWVQVRAHTVSDAAPPTCVLTLTEIEAAQANHKALLHLATHDALTGLLNRDAFMVEVEDALHRAGHGPTLVAMLFVDLDRFKDVNDRLGHQAGDTLLAVACRRVQSKLRSTECTGRLGGDELGVLCPALESRSAAVRLATRILTALEQPFTVHEEIVQTGASIGIAFADAATPSAEALVDDADQAMYQAKALGRSRCVVFGSADIEEAIVLE